MFIIVQGTSVVIVITQGLVFRTHYSSFKKTHLLDKPLWVTKAQSYLFLFITYIWICETPFTLNHIIKKYNFELLCVLRGRGVWRSLVYSRKGNLGSFTNKTDYHRITEILVKVMPNNNNRNHSLQAFTADTNNIH
jgi:hypothetical protein